LRGHIAHHDIADLDHAQLDADGSVRLALRYPGTARARIHHQGDPSNRATVRFVCESALSLALNADALPGGQARGGVLTPATGLGEVLAERLRNSGVAIAFGS
jgi:short subunit dehydrogenase-like uncharacterized protein